MNKKTAEKLKKLICEADNSCTNKEFEKVQSLIQEMYDLIDETK